MKRLGIWLRVCPLHTHLSFICRSEVSSYFCQDSQCIDGSASIICALAVGTPLGNALGYAEFLQKTLSTPMPAHPPNQQASALEEDRKLKGSYKLGSGKSPEIVKSISYIPST
jgi:hypothetical protein